MWRRKLLIVMAVTLAAVAVAAFVFWPRSDRITQENFDRILQENMSRAEVESLLGPPGDYRTGPGEAQQNLGTGLVTNWREWEPDEDSGWTADFMTTFYGVNASKNVFYARWLGDTGEVRITFYSDCVLFPDFTARRKLPQGPLDYLRWRLGRLWRTWKVSGAADARIASKASSISGITFAAAAAVTTSTFCDAALTQVVVLSSVLSFRVFTFPKNPENSET